MPKEYKPPHHRTTEAHELLGDVNHNRAVVGALLGSITNRPVTTDAERAEFLSTLVALGEAAHHPGYRHMFNVLANRINARRGHLSEGHPNVRVFDQAMQILNAGRHAAVTQTPFVPPRMAPHVAAAVDLGDVVKRLEPMVPAPPNYAEIAEDVRDAIDRGHTFDTGGEDDHSLLHRLVGAKRFRDIEGSERAARGLEGQLIKEPDADIPDEGKKVDWAAMGPKMRQVRESVLDSIPHVVEAARRMAAPRTAPVQVGMGQRLATLKPAYKAPSRAQPEWRKQATKEIGEMIRAGIIVTPDIVAKTEAAMKELYPEGAAPAAGRRPSRAPLPVAPAPRPVVAPTPIPRPQTVEELIALSYTGALDHARPEDLLREANRIRHEEHVRDRATAAAPPLAAAPPQAGAHVPLAVAQPPPQPPPPAADAAARTDPVLQQILQAQMQPPVPAATLIALPVAWTRPRPAEPDSDEELDRLYGRGIGNGGVSGELSGEEVSALAGHVRVKRYPDLADVQSWEELMGTDGAVIILFLTTSPSEGHWICAFNAEDGPHVFDPLGVALDRERFHISEEMREELGQTKPLLRRLLKTQPLKPHVSRVDYQQNKPGVNTCGRWVALRLKNRHVSDADFALRTAEACVKENLQPDEWVVRVTNNMPSHPDFLAGAGLRGGSLASVVNPMDALLSSHVDRMQQRSVAQTSSRMFERDLLLGGAVRPSIYAYKGTFNF